MSSPYTWHCGNAELSPRLNLWLFLFKASQSRADLQSALTSCGSISVRGQDSSSLDRSLLTLLFFRGASPRLPASVQGSRADSAL